MVEPAPPRARVLRQLAWRRPADCVPDGSPPSGRRRRRLRPGRPDRSVGIVHRCHCDALPIGGQRAGDASSQAYLRAIATVCNHRDHSGRASAPLRVASPAHRPGSAALAGVRARGDACLRRPRRGAVRPSPPRSPAVTASSATSRTGRSTPSPADRRRSAASMSCQQRLEPGPVPLALLADTECEDSSSRSRPTPRPVSLTKALLGALAARARQAMGAAPSYSTFRATRPSTLMPAGARTARARPHSRT